ncbi:MAG: hypothetical protein Q8N60_03595, partial [Candidatus Diapherotrites archaeon]|nr:hypothetical protein [Candidatus Diapherotrites archaeon]
MARVSWLRGPKTRGLPRFREESVEKSKHFAAAFKKGRLRTAVEQKIQEIGLRQHADEVIKANGFKIGDEKGREILRLELFKKYVAEARRGRLRRLTNRVEGTCFQFADDALRLQLFLKNHPDLVKSKPVVIQKEKAIEIFDAQARIVKNILGMYSGMPAKEAQVYKQQYADAVKNANEMRSAQPGMACRITRADRITWAIENAEEAIHEVFELLPKDTKVSFHF